MSSLIENSAHPSDPPDESSGHISPETVKIPHTISGLTEVNSMMSEANNLTEEQKADEVHKNQNQMVKQTEKDEETQRRSHLDTIGGGYIMKDNRENKGRKSRRKHSPLRIVQSISGGKKTRKKIISVIKIRKKNSEDDGKSVGEDSEGTTDKYAVLPKFEMQIHTILTSIFKKAFLFEQATLICCLTTIQ